MTAYDEEEIRKAIAARMGAKIPEITEVPSEPVIDYNGSTKVCPQCSKELPIRIFMSPKSGRIRNYCKPCYQTYQRNYTYGYYEEKPVQCEICSLVFDLDNVPRLDHNHKTGVIRGWLCHNCNLMIGHAKDDVTALTRAITYLIKNIPKI